MTGQQWTEVGVVGFSMSVLAWVIFRLTQILVRLLHPDSKSDENHDSL